MFMRVLLTAILVLTLTGCISTAVDIVTLPVRAASKTVDVLTTSQSEADEKRGRLLRKRDACIAREERKAARRGREPDLSGCPEAR